MTVLHSQKIIGVTNFPYIHYQLVILENKF